MRIIILFSILISCVYVAQSQNLEAVKDSFTLTSIPTFDINGNYYSYEKKYYHLPTNQDSIDFNNEKNDAFRPMIDSVEREVAAQQKRIEEMNRAYNSTHKQKQFAPMYPRVGKHLFSLHWISWKNFGNVIIKKIKTKKYSIKGSQKDDKGNYVTIDGILIPVVKGKLTFIGEIVTKTTGNNNGVACVKKGTYTFLCSPNRKHWRLQEMENCEGGSLVDYVDIFF
jgi:hypothetical protein